MLNMHGYYNYMNYYIFPRTVSYYEITQKCASTCYFFQKPMEMNVHEHENSFQMLELMYQQIARNDV